MLILRKEAEQDIKDAHDWYKIQRQNLGVAFLSELQRTLQVIEEHPELYEPVWKSVRRALCKRFPYAIYYLNNNSRIVVLAVLHQRRRQAEWKKRIQRRTRRST